MLTIHNKITTIFIISCVLIIGSTTKANDAWPTNFQWMYPQALETYSQFQFKWRFNLLYGHPQNCWYTASLYLSSDQNFSSTDDHLFLTDTGNFVEAGVIGYTVTVTITPNPNGSGLDLPYPGTYYVFLKLSPGTGAPTDSNASNNVVMAANPIHVGSPPPPDGFIPVPGRKAHVFDPVNQILYTTTDSGAVERYDIITGNFLSPWTIGGILGGIDVTPDGGTVLVADQNYDTINDVGYIHRVNTSSGIVTTLEFPLEGHQLEGSVLSFDPLNSTIFVSVSGGILHTSIGSPGPTEDFETGDFSKFPWEHFGDADWTITSQESNSGQYSAKAGSISNNEVTTLQVTLDCSAGNITFYRKVSSESDFDYLKFYIDGQLEEQWSGEQDWDEVSFPVTAGTRTFKWTYSKDNSISRGSDTAWIDDIVFPVVDELQTEANSQMFSNQFNSVEPSEQMLRKVEEVVEQEILSK